MAHQNMVFQQKINQRGESDFRLKFGRQKALVFKKHMASGYYYVDLYDNKPGRTDRIGLGLDELDQLCSIRSGLDSLKQCFDEPFNHQQMKGGVRQITPTAPVSGGSNATFVPPSTNGDSFVSPPPKPTSPSLKPYFSVVRIPLQENNNHQSKRPAIEGVYSEVEKNMKKSKMEADDPQRFVYENITPTTQSYDYENISPTEVNTNNIEVPQELYNELFHGTFN